MPKRPRDVAPQVAADGVEALTVEGLLRVGDALGLERPAAPECRTGAAAVARAHGKMTGGVAILPAWKLLDLSHVEDDVAAFDAQVVAPKKPQPKKRRRRRPPPGFGGDNSIEIYVAEPVPPAATSAESEPAPPATSAGSTTADATELAAIAAAREDARGRLEAMTPAQLQRAAISDNAMIQQLRAELSERSDRLRDRFARAAPRRRTGPRRRRVIDAAPVEP